MPIETGQSISDLIATNPTGNDPQSEGDDHLRLIKDVLKHQFPGAAGLGFAIPIAATEAELNYSEGLNSNIQSQIDNISSGTASIPAGSRMLFHNTSAPSGWVQDVSYNDYMLRVVSTAGAGGGGNSSPISFDHTHATSGHSLTVAEMPAHSHSVIAYTGLANLQSGGDIAIGGGTSSVVGNGASHSHGSTEVSGWSPRYTDVIICVKS